MANSNFDYFSDLYKEVNGVRPKGEFFSSLDNWEIEDWCMRLEYQLEVIEVEKAFGLNIEEEELRWEAFMAEPAPDPYEVYEV